MTVLVGISLKMYFGHAEAVAWFESVAALATGQPALADGSVRLVVLPSFISIPAAVARFDGTGVVIGAQDVAAADDGPFTGEVSASELAEVGVGVVAVGHAERRRLFGETDTVVAAKTAAALRHGLTPLICVGETAGLSVVAAATVIDQVDAALRGAPRGAVIVAYEPVWAIGASAPADDDHITTVTLALRQHLAELPARVGSSVIYGGSAGPGLLTRLGTAVDGLFLGRFAHDPGALARVLDEAAALARRVAS